jgi:hypothetical protein
MFEFMKSTMVTAFDERIGTEPQDKRCCPLFNLFASNYNETMFKQMILCALFVFGFLAMDPDTAQGAASEWKPLVPGLDYREFFMAGPNHVYVTRMDLNNRNLIVDTSLANGSLTSGLETVADQAARYDQAINYWEKSWGKRNKVIAAINGGFFNTNSGELANGMVQSGWYVKRFEDRQSIGGIAWNFDRQAFIFECLIQRPGAQEIMLENSLDTIRLDGINIQQSEDQLVLFTNHYGAPTEPSEKTVEYVIALDQPLGLPGDFSPIRGTISEVKIGTGGSLADFDHVILSASGKPADLLRGKFSPGTQILISQEIRHMDNLCHKERQPEMRNIYSALAGGSIFLRSGRVEPLNDLGSVLRNPRTAVVLNDNFLYFVVVDGRDPLRSIGMSMVELALFSRQYLGAQWGIALDGGGSSSLVVEGEVVNFPNAETIIKSHIEKQPRAVATGLMMIQIEPEDRSARFVPGNRVAVTSAGDANLRAGPGTNYLSQALITAGSQGEVQPHLLNGIQAKGYYWWLISFGEVSGWISESVLEASG